MATIFLPSTAYPDTWKTRSRPAPQAKGSQPPGPRTLKLTKVQLIGSWPPKLLLTRLNTCVSWTPLCSLEFEDKKEIVWSRHFSSWSGKAFWIANVNNIAKETENCNLCLPMLQSQKTIVNTFHVFNFHFFIANFQSAKFWEQNCTSNAAKSTFENIYLINSPESICWVNVKITIHILQRL